MRRFGKRLAAAALAAFMAVNTMTAAFAAPSPVKANYSSTTASNDLNLGQTVTVTTADGVSTVFVDADNVVTTYVFDASNEKKAVLSSELYGNDGKTYLVNTVATDSIKKKAKKLVMKLKRHTFVQSNCLSSDAAANTYKVVIKGSDLSADQFDKSAFDNFTGTIKIKSSAMSQEEFNKLKASWTGFRGTLVYS